MLTPDYHTPLYKVLLEKLTGLQLVKKFPTFYGTRRFITALTSVHHLSLSCASPIQTTVYDTVQNYKIIYCVQIPTFQSSFVCSKFRNQMFDVQQICYGLIVYTLHTKHLML